MWVGGSPRRAPASLRPPIKLAWSSCFGGRCLFWDGVGVVGSNNFRLTVVANSDLRFTAASSDSLRQHQVQLSRGW